MTLCNMLVKIHYQESVVGGIRLTTPDTQPAQFGFKVYLYTWLLKVCRPCIVKQMRGKKLLRRYCRLCWPTCTGKGIWNLHSGTQLNPLITTPVAKQEWIQEEIFMKATIQVRITYCAMALSLYIVCAWNVIFILFYTYICTREWEYVLWLTDLW